MSALHTQWADLSTSQENKRRSAANFAGQEEASVDEQQAELLSYVVPLSRNVTAESYTVPSHGLSPPKNLCEQYQKPAMLRQHRTLFLIYNASMP